MPPDSTSNNGAGRKRRPLALILSLSLAALAAAAIGATLVISIQANERNARAQVKAMLAESAILVADQAAARIGEPALLDELCSRVAARTGLRVTIVGAGGEVLAESEHDAADMENHAARAEIHNVLGGGESVAMRQRHSPTLGRRMVYVATRMVSADGRVVGACRVARRAAEVEAAESLFVGSVLAGALAAGLAALLLGIALSRRITAPLTQMERAARRMLHGDFSTRMNPSWFRECDTLAASFNTLCETLEQRIGAEARHRARLEAVLAGMTDGVLAVDAGQRVALANHAAGALFGFDAAAAVGRDIREIVRHPEISRVLSAPIPAGELLERELGFTHAPDGAARACLLHAAAFDAAPSAADADSAPAPAPAGWLLVLTDVTRLRRLMNLRKDFASSVSHELRTPVTSMLGFVETLLDGAIDEPVNARKFLSIIHAHTLRLRALINDLLALTRVEREEEAGARLLETAPLRPVLAQAVEDHLPRASARGIRLACDCPADIAARIDATLLVQAVGNLIDNAIAYSDDGSTIEARVWRDPAGARIEIRDHGCGIPEADQARIFERFYRVDKARDRARGGTGLGLAIVKHIMRIHAGSVEVESEPGKGSAFRLTIP